MNVLDLFAGIGGFSLGLRRAGMRTIAFCEADPYCQAVLRKHWPSVPIYDDVRTLEAHQLFADGIEPSVICGGFPCQPYSRAGRRRGADDPRDMVRPMLRLVEEIKPTWFVGENTEGFISSGLDSLCNAVAGLGYKVWIFGAPSCVVGLPSMEWHLWIIASPSSKRLERFGEITLQAIEDGTQEFQGSDPRGADRWHLSSARVCGVGERIPRRVDRLRALGNAVDPRMPEIIGRAIMKCE